MNGEWDRPIISPEEKLRHAVTASRQLVRTLGAFPTYAQILQECGRQVGYPLHDNWLLGAVPGADPVGKDFTAVKRVLREQGVFDAAIINGNELYTTCPTPPALVHHIIAGGVEVSWHRLAPQLAPETPPNLDGYTLDELRLLKDAIEVAIAARENAQIVGGGCIQ